MAACARVVRRRSGRLVLHLLHRDRLPGQTLATGMKSLLNDAAASGVLRREDNIRFGENEIVPDMSNSTISVFGVFRKACRC